MQIVRMIGGLGNQMFQYAFWLALKQQGQPAKLDPSGFGAYTLRQPELNRAFHIAVNDNTASENEIAALKDMAKNLRIRKLLGKILYANPNRFIRKSHFIEPNFSGFYPEALRRPDAYLDGYWQNEKYFSAIAGQVRAAFQWKAVSGKNLEAARQMETENSVAIHIRRLDQPKNLKELFFRMRLQLIWRVCTKKYYDDAIACMKARTDHPRFYIFTDQIGWVKKNILPDDDTVLVDWNRGEDSHWDLFLMTKCRHNIIAMSSYSWWGAWLNPNPGKIIIAPKKWALRFTKEINLIPESWIRI